jgi:uncharacterized membrane protein YciS (DUF1049 family)
MRLFKLITTLVILGLLGLFAYENPPIWQQSVNLRFNLYFVQPAHDVKIYLLILIALAVGFFIGLSVLLKFHFKTRRSLKRERIEKELAQAAFSQKVANSQPAASSVVNAPESGAGK